MPHANLTIYGFNVSINILIADVIASCAMANHASRNFSLQISCRLGWQCVKWKVVIIIKMLVWFIKIQCEVVLLVTIWISRNYNILLIYTVSNTFIFQLNTVQSIHIFTVYIAEQTFVYVSYFQTWFIIES